MPVILIIGGGVLGVAAAAQLGEEGTDVLLVRLADRERPRAETLRNQAWLQSGLAVFDDAHEYEEGPGRNAIAIRLRQESMELARRYGPSEVEEQRGIIRVPDGKRLEMFNRAVEKLGLSAAVQDVTGSAVGELGRFHEGGGTYFRVPDRAFNESEILELLREEARHSQVALRELSAPVRLSRERDGRVKAVVEGTEIYPAATLLAAGVGNLDLLRQLDCRTDDYETTRTPLAVIKRDQVMPVPVFADLVRGFSVTSHATSEKCARGALVLARKHPLPVTQPETDCHALSKDEIEEFWSGLPPSVQELRAFSPRYTAGLEPRLAKAAKEGPIIRKLDQLNVVVGFPGRASLGIYAADLAVKEISGILGRTPQPKDAVNPRLGVDWTGPAHMHFHDYYDNFDDLESSDGG